MMFTPEMMGDEAIWFNNNTNVNDNDNGIFDDCSHSIDYIMIFLLSNER